MIDIRLLHQFSTEFTLDIEFSTSRQVTCLFGPSGSGKTSILSFLVGFVEPQIGYFKIGDTVLHDTSNGIHVACEHRGVGLVAQDHLLFPHMTVEANLRFGMRRQKTSPTVEQHERFETICEVLEIGGLTKRMPRTLSGGESQRVAIGRALMSEPRLLLMDEPLSSLDAALGLQVMGYLEQVIQELAVPVVFVSHRQGVVRRFADWVVVIENGSKIAEGEPQSALSHNRPLEWTDEVGPVNLIHVNDIRPEGNQWVGTIGQNTIQLPFVDESQKKLFLQFTPRDVTISRDEIQGISSRIRLRGVVMQIVSVPNREFVAIDVGAVVWAEVTKQSVQELDLKPGANVYCLVKAQSSELVR